MYFSFRKFSSQCNQCDRLLLATAGADDPVALIQSAGRGHIPIDPDLKDPATGDDALRLPVPESKDRPSIDSVLSEIQEQEWYRDQIVERRSFDAKEGQKGKSLLMIITAVSTRTLTMNISCTAELDPPLSDSITKALRDARKITYLYLHQVAAIDAIGREYDVIVSTSTASGKSVIYQVGVF